MVVGRSTEVGILTDGRPFPDRDRGDVVALAVVPETGVGSHDEIARQPDLRTWIHTGRPVDPGTEEPEQQIPPGVHRPRAVLEQQDIDHTLDHADDLALQRVRTREHGM